MGFSCSYNYTLSPCESSKRITELGEVLRAPKNSVIQNRIHQAI